VLRHQEQQLVSKKENVLHLAVCINSPVPITQAQKLGDVPVMNDNKFGKFDCSKESVSKKLE
jgi:hypothetical protein